METNLFGGRPNVYVAKTTATFESLGMTTSNVNIVFEIGATLKSWKPGRSINSIDSQTTGNGYYIVMIADMDLSNATIPPIPDGSGGGDGGVVPGFTGSHGEFFQ